MRYLIAFLLYCSIAYSNEIKGFWKSVDDDTGKTNCIIAVYEYQKNWFGRIIGTCDSDGKMDDTIYHPVGRAEGVAGHPFFCGLDLIWNLVPRDDDFKGKVIDPEGGGIYDARVWVEDGKLILRGEMTLLFVTVGKKKEWLPVVHADFPPGFKIPDVSKFVPVIPESD